MLRLVNQWFRCETGALAGGAALTAAAALAGVFLTANSSAAELPGAAVFHKEVQPILAKYCYDCHGDGMNKGGVTFDQFASDQAMLENRNFWWTVLRNLRVGVMPPPKKDRPTTAEREQLERWIKTGVFGIDLKDPDPGRITVRRLNRIEYRNSIKDLTGVDFDTQVEFPPDDTGYGFDNIGDVLTVSPMLLEKYVAAAKAVVSQAVPVVDRVMAEKAISGARFHGLGNTNTARRNAAQEPLPTYSFYAPAAVSNTFNVDVAASYRLDFELAVKGNFAFDPGRCRVVIKLDGRELKNEEFGWNNKTFLRGFEEKLAAGPHEVVMELEPLTPVEKKRNSLDLKLNSLTVRGPVEKQFWIKPSNYDKYFAGEQPGSAAERRKFARSALERFASKAFRRPVDPRTLDRLTALAEADYSQPGKTVEAGIAHAMVAVLASPRFLFRMEEPVKAPATAAWAPVDEYSLASRLSYFLWSSMPDDQLMQLAARGELRKNLPAQLDRMVKDPRSESLVRNFTGQWLQTRDLEAASIDDRAVFKREVAPPKPPPGETADGAIAGLTAGPGARTNRPPRENSGNVANKAGIKLDAPTKKAMKTETEMVFSAVVHEDRSVLELIDSDYTFVDLSLAKIYGLTNQGLKVAEMKRVTLPPDSSRGGVMTEGTVLVVTSNPDRTSPVKRGLFVLDHFFGLPVPPPPANVPALEIAEKAVTDHPPTLREALARHREDALCSSCHSRMDPIGLGMENFNALGVWRETERGQTIETAGKLITGESFNTIQELKHILVERHGSDFYRCFAEKLMTYALGRGPEYYDTESVDRIVHRMESEQGRFSSLLAGIIDSAPFQEQRIRATAVMAGAREPASQVNAVQSAKTKESP